MKKPESTGTRPMETVAFTDTPLGRMTLVQRGEALSELRLAGEAYDGETVGETPLLRRAAEELAEYFAGKRETFDLPLAPDGTPFQTMVWKTLADTVPYGQTVSYGELAERCGRPAAARAVGQANHRNPLPVFVPCHRVVGSCGALVGYGGGLPMKEALLNLEKGTDLQAIRYIGYARM